MAAQGHVRSRILESLESSQEGPTIYHSSEHPGPKEVNAALICSQERQDLGLKFLLSPITSASVNVRP